KLIGSSWKGVLAAGSGAPVAKDEAAWLPASATGAVGAAGSADAAGASPPVPPSVSASPPTSVVTNPREDQRCALEVVICTFSFDRVPALDDARRGDAHRTVLRRLPHLLRCRRHVTGVTALTPLSDVVHEPTRNYSAREPSCATALAIPPGRDAARLESLQRAGAPGTPPAAAHCLRCVAWHPRARCCTPGDDEDVTQVS